MKQNDLSYEKTLTRSASLKYRAYLPDNPGTDNDKHPMLLFLHGAGERGDDLDLMASVGLPKNIEAGLDLPFITICPQCPTNQWWDIEALVAFLDDMIEQYPVDTSRVYLSGLSMGGRGTWELANRVSHKLAAIAPVCPPFIWVNPANFKDLPVWCFHGVMDSVVPITDSIKMVRYLRDAGTKVRFTTYANVDHDSWNKAYDNPELYEWLLSHSLDS